MRKGFTLVEIMIVVAIIALLAAIAIPNLLRSRMTANESAAQASLRTISTACETYAAANNGAYPTQEAQLTGATPPYLNRAYDGQTIQGYTYAYSQMTGTDYCVKAEPASATAGNRAFTINIGGILDEAAGATAPDCR